MPKISSATLLVWTVAAAEAQLACHEFIRPAHLLIGICKANEISLTEEIVGRPVSEAERERAQAEIETAQAVLRSLGADPVRLRRHTRRLLGRNRASG